MTTPEPFEDLPEVEQPEDETAEHGEALFPVTDEMRRQAQQTRW